MCKGICNRPPKKSMRTETHTSRSLLPSLMGWGWFFAFLLFISCSDSRRFRVEGEIDNLEQAEFYIYSTDGGLTKLDTIYVRDGNFKWETLIEHEATFFLVYPNLSQQVIFASPGQKVSVIGDAAQLRAINVLGTDENKAYTEFRMAHFNDSPEALTAAMRDYIATHSDSRVSTFMRTLVQNVRGTGSGIVVGQKLTDLELPPDGLSSDSTTIRLRPGRPVLLTFWASWLRETTEDFYFLLKAHRQSQHASGDKSLRVISVSLDVNPDDYRSTCRFDSLIWESRCYRQIWDTPIVSQLSITSLPYYILTDADLRVVACGSNWKDDIQRPLYSLTSNGRE